jgi:nitrite reductase (NADH) large subunit
VDRKVIVDERMRTSVPDVYAAGDCAACGTSYGLWLEAKEMGRVAGINAAGGDAVYQAKPLPVHFSGFGLEVQG